MGSVVAAQDEPPAQLVVSYAEVTEGQNEVSELGLYFTFADRTGRPLPATDSSGGQASIVVSGGNLNLTEEAEILAPDTPLFVVIVLDASGSMQATAADMRRAAIEAVNALPDGTQFSIMTFNRDISTGTPFTRTKNEVINLIGTYQPASPSDANAGTCLYDAAFAAVDKALEAELPARRTVLLFTDGRDELTAGRGDTCSTRTLDDVVTKATDVTNPVSINAVGLRGAVAIDEAGLRGMAESTKGFAAIGALNELSELFQVIVDGLNNQRVARADFCLPRGQYTATLLTQGSFDGPQLSDTFNFTTDLQCTPATPTPSVVPIVRVTTKDFNRETEEVTLQLGGENLEQITRYRVFISDPTGASIGEFQVEGGANPDPIIFSMAGRPDGRVNIDVVAVRFDGSTLETDDEIAILRPTATPSPTITPTATPTAIPTLVPVGVNVQSLEYDAVNDVIRLSIVYTQAEQVARVRVDLIDGRGFNRANRDETQLIEDVEFVANEIGLIADQQYTIRIDAFNAAGTLLNRVEQRFTYDPLRTPTPVPSNTPTPTATATPIVFIANIDAIAYDAANDLLEIRLLLDNQDQMSDIELQVLDANNLLIDTVVVDAVSPISYPGAKLIPQGRYTFRLKATDRTGRVVATGELANFIYPRVVTATPTTTPTPTPTFTPTASPTATEVLTSLEFVGLDYNIAGRVLNVQFNGANLDQIATYRVVLNDAGGVVITQQEFPPDTSVIQLPLTVETGDFAIVVSALDSAGQTIASFERDFKLTVPTATPTPQPSLAERIQENPIVAVLILVIILALVGVLAFLLISGRRDRSKQKPTLTSLPNMTQGILIQKPTEAPKTIDAPSARVDLDEPTMRPGMLDNEKTNALFNMSVGGDDEKTNAGVIVTGFLKVSESGDPKMVGKIFPLTNPFYLGRPGPRANNANFDDDKNVSRQHAEIVLENGEWLLSDNGSSLGTTVNDGARITGKVTLSEGDVIRLGGTTTLVFTRKG